MSTLTVNTINETTAANGVVIDGLKIKDYSLMYGSNIGVTVDSSGHVLKPNQPSFFARRSGSTQAISSGSWTHVVFNDVTTSGICHNIGSDYADTGTFTCPVDGVYNFNTGLAVDNIKANASYYAVKIEAGGNDFSHGLGLQAIVLARDYWNFSGSITLKLDANDTVKVHILQSNGDTGASLRANDCFFSGFLIG